LSSFKNKTKMGIVWGAPRFLKGETEVVTLAPLAAANDTMWFVWKKMKDQIKKDCIVAKKDGKSSKWFLVYTAPIDAESKTMVRYEDPILQKVVKIPSWEATRNTRLYKWIGVIEQINNIVGVEPPRGADDDIFSEMAAEHNVGVGGGDEPDGFDEPAVVVRPVRSAMKKAQGLAPTGRGRGRGRRDAPAESHVDLDQMDW
jgi:hypothetical protein